MTLPGDLTVTVLTGTFLDFTGAPLRGSLSLTPSAELVDVTGAVVVPMTERVYQLSGQGTIVTDPLVSTDNSTVEPQGWTYRLCLAINGLAPQVWNILLPYSAEPVDISALTPVVATSGVTSYLTLAGGTMTGTLTLDGSPYPLKIPAGAAAGDVLTSDASGNASWEPVSAGEIPGATSGSMGGIELNTDLGGTATAPEVVSTHLALPLPVAQGGTGDPSLTAYAPLTGGTTSTGALQQATSQFATAWGVLMSQGASAVPVWGPPTLPDGTGGLWELAVDPAGAFYTQPVLQDEAYGVITDEAGSALV